MLKLTFAGWIECRLATDPDPSDEPWGVSGYAVAFSGEPPLDRVVQTEASKAVMRKLAPDVGMKVNEVSVDGKSAKRHTLLKAELHLRESPVLEGRNDLVAPDTIEPILPVSIGLQKGKLRIERELRDLDTGEYSVVRAPGVTPRFDLLEASGVKDPKAFLENRIEELKKLLARPKLADKDKVQYQYRLEQLERVLSRGRTYNTGGPVPMHLGMTWHYVFEGPWWSIHDPSDALKGEIDGSPWIMDLWLGCWDADVLCAYMHGTLQLPHR